VATTVAFIRQLPGILEIEGDLSAQTLTVTYNTSLVNKKRVVKTIEDLGYTVNGEIVPPGE
jgi:copper chaperone CopZ